MLVTSNHSRLTYSSFGPLISWSRSTCWGCSIGLVLIFSVIRPSGCRIPTAITIVFSPQSSKSLLLGVRVDIGANDEGDKIEEWNPRFLWKECLSEGQTNGRSNPANPHNGPEASSNGSPDLMEGTSASDHRHS